MLNFRDLGGLEREDGRRVKNGLLYRCAAPYLGDLDEDRVFLESLNLYTLLDYRDKTELGVNDKDDFSHKISKKYYNIPTYVGNAKMFRLQEHPNIINIFRMIKIEDVCESYSNMPFGSEAYRQIIRSIRDFEVPLLHHCIAGKDRVGVGTAIILSLLGVKREDIIKDYMLTKPYEQTLLGEVEKHVPRIIRKAAMKRMFNCFNVRQCYIEATLDAINTTYGTLEEYLLKEFGIDNEERQKLIDYYTE